MEFKSSYNDLKKFVLVIGAGDVTTENVMKAIGLALKESKKHKCNKLLFDIRKCSIAQSYSKGFVDMMNLGEKSDLKIDHICAVVYDPKLYPEERAKFIENIINTSSSFRYKMFQSKEEAIKWLSRFEQQT